MLQNGEQAPEFALLSDNGDKVSLADFRGKKVVLYFYPKAGTPGCTQQACSLRDAYPNIEAKGAEVIGISPDAPQALAKFRTKYNLPFILLSDPDNQVARAYGAFGEKKMYGKSYEGIIRSHFSIDKEGRVMEADIKVKPEATAEMALKFVI